MSYYAKPTFRVFIATSLDGFIARNDYSMDWLTQPPKNSSHAPSTPNLSTKALYEKFMNGIECVILGRKTYDTVKEYVDWPYIGKEVLVLSRTLTDNEDMRIKVMSSVEEILELLEGREVGVYVDGGEVVREFLQRRLVEEMTVTTAPILLGKGRPLFGDLEKEVRLTLLGAGIIEDGMVVARYKVGKA